MRQASTTTFEAIFTFEDPLICPLPDVPENAGYLLERDTAEVTQLIGQFASYDEREGWLEREFESDSGG